MLAGYSYFYIQLAYIHLMYNMHEFKLFIGCFPYDRVRPSQKFQAIFTFQAKHKSEKVSLVYYAH